VCSAAPCAGQAPPRKYALLVGLNKYLYPTTGIPELEFAKADVTALASVLEQQGYEVVTLLNDHARREDVVAELSRHAALLNETDDFLLYYAGHGVRNKSVNLKTYWLTYDAQLEALDVSGIRLRHLLDYVMDIKAKRKMILLDHCFSGDLISTAAPGGGPRGAPDPQAGPPPPAGRRGGEGAARLERNAFPLNDFTQVVTAAGEGLVVIAAARGEAFELRALGHGLFTAALLAALTTREADTNHDAKLSIDELKAYLQTKVRTLANGAQEVVELTNATNTAGWFISDKLPVVTDVEAGRKADGYKRKLTEWEQKHWIATDTKNRCWDTLLNWTDSLRDGRRLNEGDQALLDRIREAMENTAAPERVRADALNLFVQSAVGGNP
jgi:hypothetical protein